MIRRKRVGLTPSIAVAKPSEPATEQTRDTPSQPNTLHSTSDSMKSAPCPIQSSGSTLEESSRDSHASPTPEASTDTPIPSKSDITPATGNTPEGIPAPLPTRRNKSRIAPNLAKLSTPTPVSQSPRIGANTSTLGDSPASEPTSNDKPESLVASIGDISDGSSPIIDNPEAAQTNSVPSTNDSATEPDLVRDKENAVSTSREQTIGGYAARRRDRYKLTPKLPGGATPSSVSQAQESPTVNDSNDAAFKVPKDPVSHSPEKEAQGPTVAGQKEETAPQASLFHRRHRSRLVPAAVRPTAKVTDNHTTHVEKHGTGQINHSVESESWVPPGMDSMGIDSTPGHELNLNPKNLIIADSPVKPKKPPDPVVGVEKAKVTIDVGELKTRRSTLTLRDMITCKVANGRKMSSAASFETPDFEVLMKTQLGRKRARWIDNEELHSEMKEEPKEEPVKGDLDPSSPKMHPNATESVNLLAPKLRIGEDGKFVLDEESLVIEQTSELSVSNSVLTQQSNLPLGTYQRTIARFDYKYTRGCTVPWTQAELERLYLGIQMVGLDFQMIMSLIPDRSYKELHKKFMNVDRRDPRLADRLLGRPLRYDQKLMRDRYQAELMKLTEDAYNRRKSKIIFEAGRRNDKHLVAEWFVERNFEEEREKKRRTSKKRLTEVPMFEDGENTSGLSEPTPNKKRQRMKAEDGGGTEKTANRVKKKKGRPVLQPEGSADEISRAIESAIAKYNTKKDELDKLQQDLLNNIRPSSKSAGADEAQLPHDAPQNSVDDLQDSSQSADDAEDVLVPDVSGFTRGIPSPPPIPENGQPGLIVIPEKLPFAFYWDGKTMQPGLVSMPEGGSDSSKVQIDPNNCEVTVGRPIQLPQALQEAARPSAAEVKQELVSPSSSQQAEDDTVQCDMEVEQCNFPKSYKADRNLTDLAESCDEGDNLNVSLTEMDAEFLGEAAAAAERMGVSPNDPSLADGEDKGSQQDENSTQVIHVVAEQLEGSQFSSQSQMFSQDSNDHVTAQPHVASEDDLTDGEFESQVQACLSEIDYIESDVEDIEIDSNTPIPTQENIDTHEEFSIATETVCEKMESDSPFIPQTVSRGIIASFGRRLEDDPCLMGGVVEGQPENNYTVPH